MRTFRSPSEILSLSAKDFVNQIDIKESDFADPISRSEPNDNDNGDDSSEDIDYDDYGDKYPMNVNANNIDVHIEPSQNKNIFE